MTEEGPSSDYVQGERDVHSVSRLQSMQSRISNLLAIGLMSLLGLGSLAWYYAHTFARQHHAKETVAAAAVTRAQGDLPLPSLGRIDLPVQPSSMDSRAPPTLPDPSPLGGTPLIEIPLAPAMPSVVNGAPSAKTPTQLAVERRLSGSVFTVQSAGLLGSTDATNGAAGGRLPESPRLAESAEPGSLAALLRPTLTTAVRAQVLPAQRLLLPKGAFIDCTLETAIDSTLPGMTTCVMATDAFGVDGSVVLLERGTKLIGETRGQVAQGAARLFVLWTEARTPTGVIVPLDSPGADELGRAGLPGEVDRHFWQRFGAALLVSVIDGAVQAATQSARSGSGSGSGSGTVVVNPSTSQDVLTEILKGTINIPPTVVKQNGDRIQVLVARDLDFRSVYELRTTPAR